MTTSSLSKDVRNIISGMCIGIVLGFFIVFFYVNDGWVKNAPSVPDPEKSLIFVHNEHGSLVYFNAVQSATNALFLWVISLFWIGVLLPPKKNIKRLFLAFNWDTDDPKKLNMITTYATAVLVIALAYFYGHQVIEALISLGLKPENDKLSE